MALARDIMRATLRARREQERRNREAMAEEKERLEQIPAKGYKPKRKMIRVGGENKMFTDLGEDKGELIPADDVDPLADLRWASPQAFAKAVTRGLFVEDFQGEEPSGRGGFTVGDVNRIAKAVTS